MLIIHEMNIWIENRQVIWIVKIVIKIDFHKIVNLFHCGGWKDLYRIHSDELLNVAVQRTLVLRPSV